MQINYALSGEHNYEPGDINIIIPTSILRTRSGGAYKTIQIPFAEEPSTRGDFNWKRVGNNFILTNTKRMSAATKGYIQFGISNIIPHEIVDMQTSDDFFARIEAVTHAGNTIGLATDTINAQIDTEAKVTNVKKISRGIKWVNANEIPESKRIPGEEEYVVASWEFWGFIESNTLYDLEIIDTMPSEYNGFMLDNDVSDPLSRTISVGESYRDGKTQIYSVKTAYPSSQFQPNTDYHFNNTVTYKVTEVDPESNGDPKLVTTKSATVTHLYRFPAPVFVEPEGHFNVFKHGNDNAAGAYMTHSSSGYYTCGDKDLESQSVLYGVYPTALNELRDGAEKVEIAYTVNSVGYMMPWTYEPDGTQLSAKKISNYFKRNVTMITTEDKLRANLYGGDMRLGVDYEYAAVEFPYQPVLMTAEPHNINEDGTFTAVYYGDGTFLYTKDTDMSHMPDIKLQIKRNGIWEDYATVSYKTENPIITPVTSAQIEGKRIYFPKNIESFRTIVTASVGAIRYDIRPVINIFNNPTVQAAADKMLQESYMPRTYIENNVNMVAYDYQDEPITRVLKEYNYDELRGYSVDIMAVPKKTARQVDVDYVNRFVTVEYTGTVEEQSFIPELKIYNEAIEEGFLIPETKGVWRDLLPKGAVPVMDSIELRAGDRIKNAYTIPNYKGSGRTLLVVEAELTPDVITYKRDGFEYYEDKIEIKFKATYGFDEMSDYGDYLHNVISFESGNDRIGSLEGYSGEPDDPSAGNNVASSVAFKDNEEKLAMTNINSAHDKETFVYAGNYLQLDILSAARTSLSKDVQVNFDGLWSDGLYYGEAEENKRIVYTNGFYSYRLRLMSDTDTISKNLRLFDSLENYIPQEGNDEIDIDAPRWKGSLLSVDTSQLEEMGCAPVVYYSTVDNLLLSDESDPNAANTLNTDLTNTSVWIKASQFQGSLIDVKAVAVDASKRADGTDFELQPEESVVVLINMKSPNAEDAAGYIADPGVWGESANAYNNAYMLCESVDANTGASNGESFVRKDYTKVGLKEYKISVKKEWDDDNDRDGIRPDEVTVRLFADGVDTGKALVINNNEEHFFTNLPFVTPAGDKIIYSIQEDAVSGYEPDIKIASDGYIVKNVHSPEKISISGTKTWIGEDDSVRPDVVWVYLLANGKQATSTAIRPDTNGEWKYEFKDVYKNENGEPIAYTVKESKYGIMASYRDEYDGFNITNTYHPYGDLVLSKEVTNATPVSRDKEFTFVVNLNDNNGDPIPGEYDYVITNELEEERTGKITAGGEVLLKGGETVRIKEIPENTKYSIQELSRPGFTITKKTGDSGTIVANTEKVANFTNRYRAVLPDTLGEDGTNITVLKKLNNKEIKRYQFVFEMYDENGRLIKTTSNQAPIETKLREDGTVEYSIAPATFGALNYTEADHGKTFVYTIKERNGGKSGYTYDSKEYKLEVSVTDNGDGTLSIKKTIFNPMDVNDFGSVKFTVVARAGNFLGLSAPIDYMPGYGFSTELSGTFNLLGHELSGSDWLDYFKDPEDYTSEENEFFSAIQDIEMFSQSITGNFIRFLDEDLGSGLTVRDWQNVDYVSEDGAYAAKRIGTYIHTDEQVYDVYVIVSESVPASPRTSRLTNIVLELASAPVIPPGFENTYTASGSQTLRAWKMLENRQLQNNEFEFELRNEQNEVIRTAKNSADGSIVFSPISYTEKDIGKTYYYQVNEKIPSEDDTSFDATINYDTNTYGYSVYVADNGDGMLAFTQSNVDTENMFIFEDKTYLLQNGYFNIKDSGYFHVNLFDDYALIHEEAGDIISSSFLITNFQEMTIT